MQKGRTATEMVKTEFKSLVVSNNDTLRQRVARLFDGADIECHGDINRLPALVKKGHHDLVLVASEAARKSDNENAKLIKSVKEGNPTTQVLFIADPEDMSQAVTTVESGAFHYAKSPVSDDELRMLITAALQEATQHLHSNHHRVPEDAVGLGQMIGRSAGIRKVFDQILHAAEVDVPVLILGETGTGKDLAAQIIHNRSQRKSHSYVAVNLGSLPTELVASELFGHEKGAFSGAVRQHQGVFERAQEGTVFLDEIDCIDEKVRVSLLRLLEQRSFRRLGGSQQLNVDIRLIAASNADLGKMAQDGEFRRDLFYRLDVFRITIPPLRERSEDIPLMVDKFAKHYAKTLNSGVTGISDSFMKTMQAYHWPGNVREMKNVIQRATLMCEGTELIPENLPPRFLDIKPSETHVTFELGTSLDEIEKTMVIRALEATNNNRKEAARLLGISRRVIYNKLKKHGLK
jgi:DNA-binding NtrC family response regulator